MYLIQFISLNLVAIKRSPMEPRGSDGERRAARRNRSHRADCFRSGPRGGRGGDLTRTLRPLLSKGPKPMHIRVTVLPREPFVQAVLGLSALANVLGSNFNTGGA